MSELETTKPLDELATLKERADKMGITYSPNIGVEKLKEKINAVLNINETKSDEVEDKEEAKRLKQMKNAMKLVRVIVTPTQSTKTELHGEIFTVSNSLVGTVKKYVPFGVEVGYHISQIIYDAIKDKKANHFYTQRVNGVDIRKYRSMPAYNVVVLDPLTEEELKNLADDQRARNAIGDN